MEKALRIQKLVDFLKENKDCPHKGFYHKESYSTHCYLVIGKALKGYEHGEISEAGLLAACLHDIGKPRTTFVKADGNACFYGHEEVTEEEVFNFLNVNYPNSEEVIALVRAHMLPLGVGESTPEPYRSMNIKKLEGFTDRWGEGLARDLNILSRYDSESSIRECSSVSEANHQALQVEGYLLQLLTAQKTLVND